VDEPVVEKSFDPPIIVRRVFAALLGVGWIVSFIVDPSLKGALWVIAICPVAALVAISPKSLRDGRSKAWEDRYPILWSIFMTAYAGLTSYLILSWFVADRLSIKIAIPFALVYGVSLVLIGRWRQRVG
jgi:hypothetical protein